MNELNLKFHYQTVRSFDEDREEFSVHEAYSYETGGLYMINPIPAYHVAETKQELKELSSMIEHDLDAYGVVNAEDIGVEFERYFDYTEQPSLELSYEDELPELLDEVSHDDKEDKVLDLVDFIKKNR